MKVLVTTYSTAFLNVGGGESELVQVVDALEQGGLQVDIYGVNSRPLNYYDVVMHFSVQEDGTAIFNAVHEKKKVILWPNVWWLEQPSEAEIVRITAFANKAHKLLFKSKVEQDNFLAYINIDPNKCIFIPIHVSDSFIEGVDTAIAKTVSKFDQYVLCLGRIEPVKNQLVLINALKALGKNGVMVGGDGDKAYFDACKDAGKDHIQFLPFIKPCSELLLSLIANSQLVAELSLDPAGRSSLEAAKMNKPLLLSDDEWVAEYFSNTVYKADPNDLDSTIKALEKALLGLDNIVPQSSYSASSANVDVMVKTLMKACI